jgi:hypothetical protein
LTIETRNEQPVTRTFNHQSSIASRVLFAGQVLFKEQLPAAFDFPIIISELLTI